jgi:uncharacterized damage-inducible protein DinB
MNPKQQFADVFARENATTRRVIRSLPEGKGEFKPYAGAKSARELAFIFSLGQGAIAAVLNGQWQWPAQMPPTPSAYGDVLAAFDATTAAVQDALARAPASRLDERVTFITGPGKTGEIPVAELMWFMLLDAVHHRGQFSTYLRMANERVPSIYGPSGDEPWM